MPTIVITKDNSGFVPFKIRAEIAAINATPIILKMSVISFPAPSFFTQLKIALKMLKN
jgi:hypothetical protein